MIVRILGVIGVCCAAAASAQPQLPPPMKVAIVDRAGAMTSLGTVPGTTFAPRISPDGRRVAFDTFDGGIWIADLSNLGAARRVITGRFPIWSADGAQLLFAGPDGTRLFSQAADGSGAPELITDRARAPEAWSSAAGLVTYITLTGETDYDVWAYSLRDRSMRPLIAQPVAGQMGSRFSPDGRWLAYESNDTGAFEVYIQPVAASGAASRVTKGGGGRAMWSADGGEIFYERDGRMYAAPVRTEPRVEIGSEVALPITNFVQAGGRRQYDLTADGKFLVMFR